ncbi:LuxR C-terminal-related transcriptional regulator [Cryobacterium sp. PH29-G1]|uniref:LuxR C-terminal-related transcriptional regulator n=1 Tax=Cryobacterium sp. PH29-G1 TaxID=3046211 RepID=UPI0024BA1D69|nr:LuxR C-terminal-related transcriptional regulator [Cryobacterium sp. PH29-G1]MDJ0349594.1 LuxR C-terminal-related transcriptional regulator [Cryobacterium sp. PH29-G1]
MGTSPNALDTANQRDAFAGGLAAFTNALTEAATRGEVRDVCVAALPGMIRTKAFGLYLFEVPFEAPSLAAASGVSDRFLTLYEDFGRDADPVLRNVVASKKPVHSSGLMSETEWIDSPFFREVLALHDMRMVLEAPILYRGKVLGTLNFADRDQNAMSTSMDHALAVVLGNMVGLAVGGMTERQEVVTDRDQLLEAFELSDQAMVVSDTKTGKRRMNSAALDMLRTLDPRNPELWFEELMAAARTSTESHCQVFSSEVLVAGEERRVILRNYPSILKERNVLVSVLHLSASFQSPTALPAAWVRELTPQESKVTGQVVFGRTDEAIAKQLSLSPYTVKQHLKAVYRKLGVHSRVELTRLVLGAVESSYATPFTRQHKSNDRSQP